MQLPTLYKKQKSGKISEWSVVVETDSEGVPTIVRTSGFTDGKKTVTKKVVKKGTNKGKANEKSPLEYAQFLANAYWKKQKEDNYFESLDDAGNEEKVVLYPMLAQPYDPEKASFPSVIQPKLNGVRCTMYRHLGDNKFLSRKGKEFTTLEFMKKEVIDIFGEYSPDGEIFMYQKPLQEIVSLLKRKQEDTTKLNYVVYDLAIPNVAYVERKKTLEKLFRSYVESGNKLQYVRLCPSAFARTDEDVQSLQRQYVEQGYEGVVIRNPFSEYKFGERTYDLMKLKNFQDKEFEIVGYEAERYYDKLKNVFKDIVIWKCRADNGKEFNVRPVGTVAMKAAMYQKGSEYIGKKLTVKYLELSNEGIPVGNPVGSFATPLGEAVRDYE